jgi:tryptophanyl-tRNA synthetase
MSSSDDAPTIALTDDPETVADAVRTHAYSGGKSSVEAHRREGGDPEVDTAYRYLHAFFEEDDAEVERIASQYRSGELLSGELKQLAIDAITDFLAAHQRRRAELGDLQEELAPFLLDDAERERALSRAGIPSL